MNIYFLPWGLLAIIIAFYFFYTINRKTRQRKEDRRHCTQEQKLTPKFILNGLSI